nr:ribonuclease H-like domain, reverse transcriptase, RNA-dependent DNA polymerase [Tanacetum cinerariifolium]
MKSRSRTLWLSDCRKKSSAIFVSGRSGSSCLVSEGSSCLYGGSSSLVSSSRSMVLSSRSCELRISSRLCVYLYSVLLFHFSLCKVEMKMCNKVDEDACKGNECNDQEKEDNVNITNNVNIVSSTVNVAGTNEDDELPFDPNMPALEDVDTFNFSNEDEDDAYASFKDFMVYQMDVKSAFLYGKIEEEVYVCQPLRFEDLDFHDGVYKVEKALYGLHQAPRAKDPRARCVLKLGVKTFGEKG